MSFLCFGSYTSLLKDAMPADARNAKNADMVSALDFAAVYGGSLGISSGDLHGDNPYGFCEYAMRRELISSALKELVMRGLVAVEKHKDGVCYKINPNGLSVIEKFDSDYGDAYLAAARAALLFASGKTEQQLLAYINKRAAVALKTGG